MINLQHISMLATNAALASGGIPVVFAGGVQVFLACACLTVNPRNSMISLSSRSCQHVAHPFGGRQVKAVCRDIADLRDPCREPLS